MDGNLGWFTGGAEWAVSTGSSFAHYHAKYAKLDASGTTAPLFAPQIISRSLGLIRFFRRPPEAACNLRFLRTLSMPLREEHRRTDAEGRCHFQCQPTRLPCRRRCNQRRCARGAAERVAPRTREKTAVPRCVNSWRVHVRPSVDAQSIRPSTHNPSPLPSPPRKSLADSRADGAGF